MQGAWTNHRTSLVRQFKQYLTLNIFFCRLAWISRTYTVDSRLAGTSLLRTPREFPGCAYIRRGDLTGGFLRYDLGGLLFGGACTWRGLFSKFYGIIKWQCKLKSQLQYQWGIIAHSGPTKTTTKFHILWRLMQSFKHQIIVPVSNKLCSYWIPSLVSSYLSTFLFSASLSKKISCRLLLDYPSFKVDNNVANIY